ncbi:hypothetical protein BHE74_00025498 [Ensete ventricosum]|nr:hypothetical protein GW17_00025477 [Ensete ventricosum]RWW67074.1 hypothetical protein BHE74_00025498 [Ensete ventricosum]
MPRRNLTTNTQEKADISLTKPKKFRLESQGVVEGDPVVEGTGYEVDQFFKGSSIVTIRKQARERRKGCTSPRAPAA